MAKKDAYTALCAEIAEKVKQKGKAHSKTDMVAMAQSMINTPEHEVDVYVGSATKGDPTVVTTTPVKAYRESLKPVLKSFGIDNDELNKIQDVQFPKKHAEALCELATNLVKDYTSTGRKLVFPINAKNESRMSISQVEVAEKKTEPKKIVKDEKSGKYELIPTGKKVTTKKHEALKAANKVPYWLKDIK